MNNDLSRFLLADKAQMQIRQYIRRNVKASHLAEKITKLMHESFSSLTLAQLDKKIAIHGFSNKFEILAISGRAVNDLLGRDLNPVLDQQVLEEAWQLVYRNGVCPCNNRYQ
ncbi:hypothetical protein [Shewanella algae]